MKRIFLAISFLVAVSGTLAAQSTRIGTRQWTLTGLNGSAIGYTKAYMELDSHQTKFSGHTGCNRMFGAVAIRGSEIAFSNVGTTRMACVEAKDQRTETGFLTALRTVDHFRLSGNTLELLKDKRVLIRFDAPIKRAPVQSDDPAPSADGLEDKKWTLNMIGGTPVEKLGRGAFVVFDRDKASVGGNSSCNVFGGSYEVAGSTLRITDVVSTMRACIEDNRMDIERQFLDALRETDRYEIRDGKLMLYRNEELLLTLIGEPK
jgi:heat shock protein HslJ